jgi:N-methylhydantoinase B
MNRFDPLLLPAFWRRLQAIVEQQALALIRTSFTPAVSECGDLSACVFDASGAMLAQAVTGTPGHINSMARCVADVLAICPPDSLEPGDVLITNDPWLTSGHHYDITVITPMFRGGRLVAHFGSICHTADFGGRPYGPDGVDVYEEGLELPVLKLYRAGRRNDDLHDIIAANVRYPEQVVGDIHAQVAGNQLGAQRLADFMDASGVEDLEPFADELMSRTETAMREAIRAVPDGRYQYRTAVDGFDDPIDLALAIDIVDDQLVADFSGTGAQVPQAINVVMNYTEAYTTFGIKCALAPDIPNDAGSFRPVRVSAPPGSILNCERPSPVAARHLLGHFLPGMVLGALAPVIGDRAMAEGAASLWSTNVHGEDADGNRFSLLSFLTGGTGARPGLDGLSATAFPSGVSGMPVEVFENRSPLVMVERTLRTDSGGPGASRGGLGYRTTYAGMRLERPYRLSMFADRIRTVPAGLAGGLDGAPGSVRLEDGTQLGGKQTVVVRPADVVVIETPGGAGFGDPRSRPAELVASDVDDRMVSHQQARASYGVAISDSGEIDAGETARLRDDV